MRRIAENLIPVMWRRRRLRDVMTAISIFTLISACGGSSNSSNPSATPTQTPAPQPSGSTCTFPQLAGGVTVFYAGTKGNAPFTDPNRSYTGTVQTYYGNGQVQVTWKDSGTTTVLSYTLIFPQGTCSPDITGKAVLYVGPQGASYPNFDTVGTNYTGTIVAAYAGGFLEVKWSHLTYDTIEPLANLSIGQ